MRFIVNRQNQDLQDPDCLNRGESRMAQITRILSPFIDNFQV